MTSPREPDDEATALRGMEGLIAAMRGRRGADTVDVLAPDAATASVRGGVGTPEAEDDLAAIAWRAMHVSLSSSSGEAEGCVDDQPAFLERGAVVGRYVILRQLGAGGMGVVYAAYDPELDRKLALKLVLPGRGDEEGRTRLLREAQALARLSHRNVVAVHDVGTMGGQVWLAMEFVRGQTLREWLRTPRSWREVLGVLRKAGRGLAAAHAAGLLHRDFKPDNVMVGARGRVRVMDFGLARGRPNATPAADESTIETVRVVGTLAMQVTQVGALLGTPVYMAPEQLLGREPTPAVDQYALCVTLWEALYGERPFAGDTLEQLVASVIAGRVREPTSGRGVPGWLRRVCERGLSTTPEQRFPSMDALLHALANGQARARTRKGLAALAALIALGLGGTGARQWEESQRVAACEATGAEIETAWNAERKQALHDAVLATGVSYAPTTAENVMPWLDRQAVAWREARVEACLAAEVRGRWDARQLARSLWCLEERHTELASLVDELTAADAAVVRKAVEAVTGLAPVTQCRDERTLELLEVPSSEQRASIEDVRDELTRAASLERAGRYRGGLEVARGALERAEALEWSPLVARAHLRVGSLAAKLGEHDEAAAAYEDAYFGALHGVDPEAVVQASLGMVLVVGVRMARPAEARHWGRLAEAALVDIHDGGQLYRAALLATLADLDMNAGAYHDAKSRFEQALAIMEASLAPDHTNVAAVLNDLAVVHSATDDHEEAQPLLERAVSIWEGALGPDHPRVAGGLHNLGDLYWNTGALDEAKELHERALAIRVDALGPEHPEVGMSLDNLAGIHAELGDLAMARALSESGVAVVEGALGPEHPTVAISLGTLAYVLMESGAHADAQVVCERGLAILEAALGPEHPFVSDKLVCLAQIALAEARPSDAVPLARRSVTILEQQATSTELLADSRFILAQALWDAPIDGGGDRTRARALAEEARAHYLEHEGGDPDSLAEIEAWLADR